MVNTGAIKERMVQTGVTQKDISKALGLAQPTVSQKLNNRRPFYLDEAIKLANMLGIEPTRFSDFFFCR